MKFSNKKRKILEYTFFIWTVSEFIPLNGLNTGR